MLAGPGPGPGAGGGLSDRLARSHLWLSRYPAWCSLINIAEAGSVVITPGEGAAQVGE